MIKKPENGKKIQIVNGELNIPDNPIIPFIEGDGIGPDIWKATKRVIDAGVEKAYNGKKKIEWMEIFAGEKAYENFNMWLPEETIDAIKEYVVAIKGPLTTPVGGGIRSLNVSLRQKLNLYSCVRPVRYYDGVPTPLLHPEKLDVVIFRENTEDLYAGIEWEEGSENAKNVIEYLNNNFNTSILKDSGIGIKPISISGTKRLVRKAIQYALDNNRKSVTLMHKGNIMKFTEGAFKKWGYELAKEEFSTETITEEELWDKFDGNIPEDKIVIKDRIADALFQLVLLRPDDFDVIATPNLNGDYISDACAAQVGGLGIAPGANIGDNLALFEATHGTAPKYANLDKINPTSLLLSGVMMLKYIGFKSSADMIEKAIGKTIKQKKVTYDLHRQMEGATLCKTSEYASTIIENL